MLLTATSSPIVATEFQARLVSILGSFCFCFCFASADALRDVAVPSIIEMIGC
jgi:hypothetical protein